MMPTPNRMRPGHPLCVLLAAMLALLAVSCATEQPAKYAIPGKPLIFADLPSFDRALAQSLSLAKKPVVVTSADHITLKQFPPRLEKWLAAVDDGGGKIETHAVGTAEPPSRSLGLLVSLVSAIRLAREYVHEQQYADARQCNAKIYYRMNAAGDRVLQRIEFTRRPR